MIKTFPDALLVGGLLAGFLCMATGFTILIIQALKSSDRRRMLWKVLSLPDSPEGLDPRGLKLIFAGACIGVVLFAALCIFIR